MKRKVKGFLSGVLSVALVIAIILSTNLHAIAQGNKNETLYVKDVIFIYGEDLKEAKSRVPDGYIMLETDLNQGAAYVFAVDDVYLAYSTTTNPDEAITDIKMMNMNGGFVLSDYEEQLQNVSNNVKEMATELKVAVEVFVENYSKGTYGAKAAYKTLTAFTVDEADNKTLAEYFVNGEATDQFYLKLILNAHNNILSAILSALTMAVQGEKGNTWLDRLSKIDDPEGSFDVDYWDKAVLLWPHFNSFYEAYSSIDHDLFQTGSAEIYAPSDSEGNRGADISSVANNATVANTGMELLYEVAYSALEGYSFGNGIPVSEWLVNDYLYEEMLYPLIEALTPAEFAMMHLCGPLNMILSTSMNESVYNDYIADLTGITDEMGTCSVWHGVNTEIFQSSIGITDEASRAIAETEAEQEFNNDGDSGLDDTIKFAGLIASVGAIALGVGVTLTSFTAGSLGALLTGATASSFAVAGAIVGTLFIAAGIVIVCVALVVAVVYLVCWLKEWYDEHHPEYTEIPEYMYDLVVDDEENRQFVLYEVAKSHDGKPVDVNAFEGKQWHAPYISRDSAAGNPIEADFIIRLSDGRVDEGYQGLCNFGETISENLNHYADSDDVGGIYVSYKQEKQSGAYARGKYLSDVKLFTGDNAEQCKIKIENERYTVYNLNLTPNSDKCTYLGYKTSNKANLALTDIRFAYGYSATQYSAGGASETYAASGSNGMLTLYTTRVSLFGSPILSDFVILDNRNAQSGYEPVNLFSGGPAVNININHENITETKKEFYLYFLPSKAYTSGTEYLGGVATIYSTIRKGFTNTTADVPEAIKILGYDELFNIKGSSKTSGAVLYTKTYNPYRAIYKISAISNGGATGEIFNETIKLDGIGYSLATRYIADVSEKTVFEKNTRENDSRLYVAGVYKNGTPMKLSDIAIAGDENFEKDGFIPLSAALTGGSGAVNLSSAFNYTHEGTYASVRDFTMNPAYVFVRDEAYEEGKYVTNLYISSKEQVKSGMEIDCSELDTSYVANALANYGAHSIISQNLNLKDSINKTYLGYTKNASSRTPITDVVLYYAGETKKEPEAKQKLNNITYHLVGDVNLFCAEGGTNDKCQRVYLYYTTNPAAGEPVLDIKIDKKAILNGWETVRTQNKKALYDDMDAYGNKMWFIHLKRQENEPAFISEIVVGWGSETEAKAKLVEAGCDYMLSKDLNDGCGAASDYIYLGYKKTNDVALAIRDIRTTHDKNVKTFEKNGCVYNKVEGNLNSYTNVFADDIYLYYTKNSKAGSPLVNLTTKSKAVATKIDDGIEISTVVNQKDKASDLNDGALGDYIYLIQYKDENAEPLVASMIGDGSVMAIIGFASASAVFMLIFYYRKKRCENDAEATAEKKK